MRKRYWWIGLAMTPVALIMVIALQAQEIDDSPFAVLGEDQYQSCGLHKLSYEEQDQLLSIFSGAPPQSFLTESAFRYLEEQRWERVQILGLIEVDKPGEDYYVLGSYHAELYTLDPSIIPYLPDPGLYWAQVGGPTWKLLYPNGKTGDFWEKDLN